MPDDAPQLGRFRRFLAALIPLTFLCSAIGFASGAVLHNRPLIVEGTLVLALGIVFVIARAMTLRGHVAHGAAIVSYALLAITIATAFNVPLDMPALTLVPFIAVTAALPYLRAARLRVLFVMAFVVECAVGVVAALYPRGAALPIQWRAIIVVSAVAVAAFLSLLVLQQFSSRLGLALDKALAAGDERAILLERERAAKDVANSAVRARDEFIAVAAHELRTPLTPLILLLGSVQRKTNQILPEPVRVRIEGEVVDAARQLDRLARLVENLLDMPRADGDSPIRLRTEPIDFATLVREVVGQFQERLDRAGCVLTLEASQRVLGTWDRLRLVQVVVNLLGNAVKYGGGKPIEVRVDTHEGRARLAVRDHGIGIPEAELERMFEPFARAAPITSYGGLGLGLYISRRIVEAHGGSIRAESKEGQGAKLVVELPVVG